jgi:hypothetical protein
MVARFPDRNYFKMIEGKDTEENTLDSIEILIHFGKFCNAMGHDVLCCLNCISITMLGLQVRSIRENLQKSRINTIQTRFK